MGQEFFITGTDTDVGKTYTAKNLLSAITKNGFSGVGFKPVASGSVKTEYGLRNQDAVYLRQNSSFSIDYSLVNPYVFEPAIAPHLAAKYDSKQVTVDGLINNYMAIRELNADYIITEGAGGWYVPLNDHETLADFAIAVNVPVIMVVIVKLGCINHALLTYEALLKSGLPIIGWLANCPEEIDCSKDIIYSIQQRLPIMLIDIVYKDQRPDFSKIISF